MKIRVLILYFLCCSAIMLHGQEVDTTSKDRINIVHADDAFFSQEKGGLKQRLIGNVTLYQDSTFFYCDSAIIMDNQVWAGGNIQILQGDSTSIFADSLYFSGDDKMAELFGEVSLLDKENQLFTDHLTYDLTEKRASYETGARLKNGETQIKSRRGYYLVETNQALFRDSVVVVNKEFELQADSLVFNTEEERAIFQGPTQITQRGNEIYCEKGYYDFKSSTAYFAQNAAFDKDGQRGSADEMYYFDSTSTFIMKGKALLTENDKEAKGDEIIYREKDETIELIGNGSFKDGEKAIAGERIFYNQRTEALETEGGSDIQDGDQRIIANSVTFDQVTGMGSASGNVTWQDTANDMAIHSDELKYNKETGYVKATGDRPWMEIFMDGDTLFVSGDTLISDSVTDTVRIDSLNFSLDTSRRILIYNDVKIYKKDMQAICDSMIFLEKDSMFRLLNRPLVWSDTSQFSGDTIDIYLKDKTVDRVHQINNAMIINSADLVFYNQITGKDIMNEFVEGKPDETFVEGNARALYFALDDDDAYIAANKSECSRIRIEFGEKQIKHIHFITQPEAEMLPMSTPGLQNIRLDGFFWESEGRPISKTDVILRHVH